MKLIRPPQEVKGPTPETKSKAREGVIGLLQRRKYLEPEHLTAADLLEAAINLANDKVGYKLMKFEERGYDLSHRPPSDVGGKLAIILILYERWLRELTRRRAAGLYKITVDLVWEGRRLRETERRYGMESGTAKHHLRRSLDIYCQEAGWSNMGME